MHLAFVIAVVLDIVFTTSVWHHNTNHLIKYGWACVYTRCYSDTSFLPDTQPWTLRIGITYVETHMHIPIAHLHVYVSMRSLVCILLRSVTYLMIVVCGEHLKHIFSHRVHIIHDLLAVCFVLKCSHNCARCKNMIKLNIKNLLRW